MPQTAIYGTQALSPANTAWGCKWTAFSCEFAQGVTSYYGFGDIGMTVYGTIFSWSGHLAGFTTHGSSNDVLGTALMEGGASTAVNRVPFSQTFQWATGCTIVGSILVTDLVAAVPFLGTDTSVYRFVGSGVPAETWS